MSNQSHHIMTTKSFFEQRTYWDVYKDLSKLADEASAAMENIPVGTNEWYKAWGYADAMRQACIETLPDHD